MVSCNLLRVSGATSSCNDQKVCERSYSYSYSCRRRKGPIFPSLPRKNGTNQIFHLIIIICSLYVQLSVSKDQMQQKEEQRIRVKNVIRSKFCKQKLEKARLIKQRKEQYVLFRPIIRRALLLFIKVLQICNIGQNNIYSFLSFSHFVIVRVNFTQGN